MKKDIAIFGAGGFGREVAIMIRNTEFLNSRWNFIGFYDDTIEKGTRISNLGSVLGGLEELNTIQDELNIVIALGYPQGRKVVSENLINDKLTFPNLYPDPAMIQDLETLSVGKGNIFKEGCSISCNVAIGDFNIFNGTNAFGHDAVIGNYNSFMPRTCISGNVNIGDSNLFGTGSIVIEKIKIGNNVHLSPGSVLLNKPKDNALYVGNPARRIKY